MRILLADDQAKVRFALRVLLEKQPGVEVVGEATDASVLADLMKEVCPDLVLLGWELPGEIRADLIRQLHEICPRAAIVALSSRLEARRPALEAGADGFLCKCDSPEYLLNLVAELQGSSPSLQASRAP
jgi:DNA-binding NarL/FixJ family response regulator